MSCSMCSMWPSVWCLRCRSSAFAWALVIWRRRTALLIADYFRDRLRRHLLGDKLLGEAAPQLLAHLASASTPRHESASGFARLGCQLSTPFV